MILIFIILIILFLIWFIADHIDMGHFTCPKCTSDMMIIQDYFLTCQRCGKSFPPVEINSLIDGGNYGE
jgi:hypothetical protein